MSPSRSTAHVETHRSLGCLWVFVAAIVGLLAIFLIWGGIASAIHASHGREISRTGTELLAVLDSYSPIEPAEGSRDQDRLSDLWDDSNDPTRRWNYLGEARFDIESNGDGMNLEEAFEAFRVELTERGWSGGEPSPFATGGYIYSKGDWNLTLHYGPESKDPANQNRISSYIESPTAGGPLPA